MSLLCICMYLYKAPFPRLGLLSGIPLCPTRSITYSTAQSTAEENCAGEDIYIWSSRLLANCPMHLTMEFSLAVWLCHEPSIAHYFVHCTVQAGPSGTAGNHLGTCTRYPVVLSRCTSMVTSRGYYDGPWPISPRFVRRSVVGVLVCLTGERSLPHSSARAASKMQPTQYFSYLRT